ncbi:F0F1 ATP synthase subunit epsilon [Cutibacterium sp. WCA-380-WT-3A]|uniref:ATP synthase epsilon chain n=1 Tax=Cutibacterium porci TaxID=2605781 RepID=A0A7K0J655_9ACTN|nr:F0F1 ATP synthase subunit epsilon [Cutibacterium porci]MSS45425.1 F0F1 ATP synthase subunit epsilon [Cutibacterium porci]
MDYPPLHVKVVSADREVWKGESVNIIVRTTEGDIGLLPGHEAFLAALVPCAAQIITTDGSREVIACEGGFVSLDNDGNVSIITQYATRSDEISVEQAERDRDSLRKQLNEHERSEQDSEVIQDVTHRLRLAQAQIAASRVSGKQHS